MAPFRFAEWCLRGEEIQLFGDGKQSRDFTYVDDIALGTIAALQKRLPGFEIINLGGGGERTTIYETNSNRPSRLLGLMQTRIVNSRIQRYSSMTTT